MNIQALSHCTTFTNVKTKVSKEKKHILVDCKEEMAAALVTEPYSWDFMYVVLLGHKVNT